MSLHYFNSYAVADRINFSSLSEYKPSHTVDDELVKSLLPTDSDLEQILHNFEIHASRILVKHLPPLKRLSEVIVSHIPHMYSAEMSKKSVVYPLGIQLKSENQMDEMVSIVDELHKYVPMLRVEKEVDVPEEAPKQVQIDYFHPILFGGDQMTCVRIRGAQGIRENAITGRARLEGVVPVIEDWHAKVCFMQVIWTRLYGHQSNTDGGTLLQLRNILNRSSVPTDPKKDVNAAEDFLEVVLIGHVVAAGMQILGMKTMKDQPNDALPLSEQLSKNQKEQVLKSVAHDLVSRFVNLDIEVLRNTSTADQKTKTESKDAVLEYAKECLTLCLLKEEFDDAIHEGDGQRLIRCWKFFLLIFKCTNHKNYSIEALNLLAQYYVLLPPRLANQLIYSRFVNVHGAPGRNISCDLHMEHINAACKFAIAGLGSNVTPQAISRIGKCIGPLMSVCEQFDAVFHLHGLPSQHRMPNLAKDVETVVKELSERSSVFCYEKGRKHPSFKSVTGSLISKLDNKKLLKWMNTKLKAAVL